MRNAQKMLMAAAILLLPMVTNAQTENPRGIYKMITLTGRGGEINAPWDQYKICTDSVTLMASFNKNQFHVSRNDKKVFNYTGSEPQDENDKSTRVYDSNADHFTEKWWSKYENHIYFPKDDWCIEKYEANKYSDVARPVFDILTSVPAINAKNPILGTWKVIGWMDELKDAKKQLKTLQDAYEDSKYKGQYFVITSTNIAPLQIYGKACNGILQPTEILSKNAIINNGKTVSIKWLTKDIIAMEVKIDYRTDWQIMERVTESQSLMSYIASLNVQK